MIPVVSFLALLACLAGTALSFLTGPVWLSYLFAFGVLVAAVLFVSSAAKARRW